MRRALTSEKVGLVNAQSVYSKGLSYDIKLDIDFYWFFIIPYTQWYMELLSHLDKQPMIFFWKAAQLKNNEPFSSETNSLSW